MFNSLRKVFNLIKPEEKIEVSSLIQASETVVKPQPQKVDLVQYQKIEAQLKSTEEQLAKSQAQAQSIDSDLIVAKTQITVLTSESKFQQDQMQAKIDSIGSELTVANSKVNSLTVDIRAQQDRLKSLMQSETNAIANSEKTIAKLVELEKEFFAFKVKYDQFSAEKNKAIADKQFLEGKRKELEENLTQAIKEKNKALDDRQLIEKQLSRSKDEVKQALGSREKDYLANKQLNLKVGELRSSLEAEKKVHEALILENKTFKDDLDSMLLHLHQVQEELERYYFGNEALKAENQTLRSRWDRFQKRMPGYLDFRVAEVQSYDDLSEGQVISWRVEDYVHNSGIELSELLFKTEFKDGISSIILTDPTGVIEDIALTPKLVFSDQAHASKFRAIGSAQWQRIISSINVLEYGASIAWKGFSLPESYDPSFYTALFSQLISEFKKLPGIMRFDRVKLKRELQNPDYEHLWLEIYGLSYKQFQKPKLEMRLGAQLEKGVEFSQLPKFEFPLIDGKLEPFESWFAESADDFGSKFELRFALDKNVFDFGTWSRLSLADRELTYWLISLAPMMLEQMSSRHVPINRDWKDWLALSTKSSALLAALIQRARDEKLPSDDAEKSGEINRAQATSKKIVKEVTIASKAKKTTPIKKTTTPVKKLVKTGR